jgi:RNA polymerase sigma factor (sigma-70 family)
MRGLFVRDDPTVAALVTRAAKGDQSAWDEIVERYAALVWSICRRYRLERSEVDDVAQNVWLRLVEQLPALREPAALPGWLATTTQRECIHVLRVSDGLARRKERLADEITTAAQPATIDEEIITAEWHDALRAAFAQLPVLCRDLLSMLIRNPPLPYVEISRRTGIPVGGIGPNRARCLARMRRCAPLADLLDDERYEGGGELGA